MIPRLTIGGASFKGAALYYLADKREPGEAVRTTTDRVAWTQTVNLPTDDADRAWRMMAHTAMSQSALKQAAGVKATGRKLTKPVMAYSLAWSPDEAPPDKAEMIEAAKASLAALGLEQHQALIVCHTDTEHPHVHVIVNRVDPANGIAHKGSKTKLVLSAWAEAYERERGQILCIERVENNAARRQKEKPARQPKVARNQWQARQADPDRAVFVAATYAEAFSDIAATERAGVAQRQREQTMFAAQRKASREAIRARYQAATEQAVRPDLAAVHATLADGLLQADPTIGLATLTRDRSTFTRQDLARHVGRHTETVEAFQAVLAKLEASPDLVPIGRDERGQQRYTTREHQAVERRMVDLAVTLHGRPGQGVRPLWPKSLALSQDQNAALHHVVGPERLALIVGIAGTGKSTMMGAAKRSWEAAGLTVRGMALSGIAADSLKSGSGIASHTIHSRLRQWEDGKDLPTRKEVIVVDEAGMIGSRQMERILHFAEQGGAKVVLIGDPEQLQAIEAGGAFRLLSERFGAADIETVRRQRTDWQQQATRELATAETTAAVVRYEAAGTVHAHKGQDDAKAALVAAWRQTAIKEPKASQIILAFTRADVRDLNDRARALRREAGELGEDRTLETATGKRQFAAGDRIYFLKNDAGLGVRNGTQATIVRIERQTVIVKLDGEEGRQVMFGMANYSHIDHGYAATIHKSQGVTVDRTHLLASRNLDRHSTYVAMSRHRDRVDVHWSTETFENRASMLRRLSRAAVKDTSLDYEQEPDAERPAVSPRPARKSAPPGKVAVSRQAVPRKEAPPPPEPFVPKEPAPAPAPDERAERIAGILDRLKRGGREAVIASPPATARTAPIGTQAKPGQAALDRLWQERHEARQRQRDEAAIRRATDHEPPRRIEGPRASDPQPIVITVTAELAAFDRATATLARAMSGRHEAEIATEEIQRATVTAEAALDWYKVGREPVGWDGQGHEPNEPWDTIGERAGQDRPDEQDLVLPVVRPRGPRPG